MSEKTDARELGTDKRPLRGNRGRRPHERKDYEAAECAPHATVADADTRDPEKSVRIDRAHPARCAREAKKVERL